MKNIVPDYRLDMVGEPCPYPAVATLEAMPQLKKGEILEVVSDCPQSINNIPLDARNHGYTVLDIQQDGPTIRYLIQIVIICRMTAQAPYPACMMHSAGLATPASTSLPGTPTSVCCVPEYPSALRQTLFAYRSSHH